MADSQSVGCSRAGAVSAPDRERSFQSSVSAHEDYAFSVGEVFWVVLINSQNPDRNRMESQLDGIRFRSVVQGAMVKTLYVCQVECRPVSRSSRRSHKPYQS